VVVRKSRILVFADARLLPCSIIAYADSDSARRELDHGRPFTGPEQSLPGCFRKAVDAAPFPEAENPVAVLWPPDFIFA
jgi:hypothetical protein